MAKGKKQSKRPQAQHKPTAGPSHRPRKACCSCGRLGIDDVSVSRFGREAGVQNFPCDFAPCERRHATLLPRGLYSFCLKCRIKALQRQTAIDQRRFAVQYRSKSKATQIRQH